MKTIYFVSGLPRAGSTLLANLLAQNPYFKVTPTSGLVDMLLLVRNSWDRLEEFRAMPPAESERTKLRVLRGMVNSYHGMWHWAVFDRSRSWLAHLEMIEAILGERVKVLVPVRDVRQILASLELLWRRHSATRQLSWEHHHYPVFQSAPGRCGVWAGPEGMLGIAYARVRDAFQRGLGSRLHLVPYERLASNPYNTLKDVYDFLGESWHPHDFEKVEARIEEDDHAYGIPGLHELGDKIRLSSTDWRTVLGEAAAPYDVLNAALGYPGAEITIKRNGHAEDLGPNLAVFDQED